MEALNIRKVDTEVVRRFKASAALMGMTLPEYLAHLVNQPSAASLPAAADDASKSTAQGA